jgi:hypothetical protein
VFRHKPLKTGLWCFTTKPLCGVSPRNQFVVLSPQSLWCCTTTFVVLHHKSTLRCFTTQLRCGVKHRELCGVAPPIHFAAFRQNVCGVTTNPVCGGSAERLWCSATNHLKRGCGVLPQNHFVVFHRGPSLWCVTTKFVVFHHKTSCWCFATKPVSPLWCFTTNPPCCVSPQTQFVAFRHKVCGLAPQDLFVVFTTQHFVAFRHKITLRCFTS